MKRRELKRDDLVEPELSYQIVGALYEVYNALGYGYSEIHYQRAIERAFQEVNLKFQREVPFPVRFHEIIIAKRRVDFLVAGKILLEIKKGKRFSRQHIEQVVDYLRASGLGLAILANFAPEGVLFKRIVNDKNSYIRSVS